MDDVSTETLTAEQEKALISKCENYWSQGEGQLNDARNRTALLIRAYNALHPKEFYDDPKNKLKTKAHLAWEFKTVRQAHARLFSYLIPTEKEADLFNIPTRITDYQPGVDLMTRIINAQMDDYGFDQVFEDSLLTVLFGETTVYADWKAGYDSSEIEFACIPYRDVVVYPITERPDKAVMGFQSFKPKAELQEQAEVMGYKNIDQIDDTDAKQLDEYTSRQSESTASSISPSVTGKRQGHSVRTYWMPSVMVGGKTYKNAVATIVNSKVLLRFQVGYNYRPYHYCIFMKNVDPQYGVINSGQGLVDKAYEIGKQGNLVQNQNFDYLRKLVDPPLKFVIDDVFRPDKAVIGPSVLLPVGDLANLQPVYTYTGGLNIGMQEVQTLKAWFEELAAVPEFYTGQAQNGPNDTATSQRLKADGADTQFRMFGRHISRHLIKPVIEQLYKMNDQRMMLELMLYQTVEASPKGSLLRYIHKLEPDFLSKHQPIERDDYDPVGVYPMTGQPIYPKSIFPDLDAVDVDVDYFESMLQKMDRMANTERFLGTLGGVAEKMPEVVDNFKPDELIRGYAKDLGLGRYTRDQSEVDQKREERAIQQQMEAQQQAASQADAQQDQMMMQAHQQASQEQEKQDDREHQMELAVLNNAMRQQPNG